LRELVKTEHAKIDMKVAANNKKNGSVPMTTTNTAMKATPSKPEVNQSPTTKQSVQKSPTTKPEVKKTAPAKEEVKTPSAKKDIKMSPKKDGKL